MEPSLDSLATIFLFYFISLDFYNFSLKLIILIPLNYMRFIYKVDYFDSFNYTDFYIPIKLFSWFSPLYDIGFLSSFLLWINLQVL